MRSVRVREALLIIALVGVGLGWAMDRARIARRDAAGNMRTFELAERVVAAEAMAEDLARRLRECEARGVNPAPPTPGTGTRR